MNVPLLEIDDLTVHVPTPSGPRLLIEGVTLDVQRGEAVGLVGESGSGKSTTARSVLRVLPVGASLAGSVRVDGDEVTTMKQSALSRIRAKKVQMIFQDPKAHVNPVLSVGDFLTEGLRTHAGLKRQAAEERVVGLLEEVGVSRARRRLQQYPHELSGGLLQRIMIAAVLAVDPELLIADEPTTALDVTTQLDVISLINRLRQERGMAILFITHDLELATTFCERTAVMYAGRIVESQPTGRLHSDPLHPYTAALFASRPDVTRVIGRLPVIPGSPISAAETPRGCSFHPRCSFGETRCREERPPLVERGGGRAACLRVDELRETLHERVAESV